jgi:hypothetical protein
VYASTNVWLRSNASILAYLFWAATRGAGFAGAHGGSANRATLREHGAPTTYPPAGALPLRRALSLDRPDTIP